MAWQVVLLPASLKVRACWLFLAIANLADPSLQTRSNDQPRDHDDDSPLRLSLVCLAPRLGSPRTARLVDTRDSWSRVRSPSERLGPLVPSERLVRSFPVCPVLSRPLFRPCSQLTSPSPSHAPSLPRPSRPSSWLTSDRSSRRHARLLV